MQTAKLEDTIAVQDAAVTQVGLLEELMVPKFPFQASAAAGASRRAPLPPPAARAPAHRPRSALSFPFLSFPAPLAAQVPKEFDGLPRLYGRASVEVTVKRGPDAEEPTFNVNGELIPTIVTTLILDGYSARTAGGRAAALPPARRAACPPAPRL